MDKDTNSYKFMKEVIKKEPPNRKKQLAKGLLFLVMAVVFGVIAGAVCAVTTPIFSDMLESREKLDIPADDDPNDGEEKNGSSGKSGDGSSQNSSSGDGSGQSSSSGDGSGQSSSSGDGSGQSSSSEDGNSQSSSSGDGNGEKTAPSGEGSSNTGTETTPTPVPTKECTAEDYLKICREMAATGLAAEKSLVTVIGITNQMDYFNQNYENQQQITGIILAEKGQDILILTEYRIVEQVERIQVTFWDGTTVDAIYQKHDANTGLTILKVEQSKIKGETLESLEAVSLGNSYSVSRGEPVIAVGSPMGYSRSIAYGMVTSVTNRISTVDTEYTLLTTDIPGSAEGSGVLINLKGEVVGIIAQNYSFDDKSIVTGIAISQIKSLLEALSNNEKRAYIGIKGQDVTDELSERTGIPNGVLVNEVAEASPAMFAGIMEYDVIVRIGAVEVRTLKEYKDALGRHNPGEVLRVIAMRKGAEGYAEMEFVVTLGES